MTYLDLEKLRRDTNKIIREMKISQPFIFREWQRLWDAETALREARQELEWAQKAWADLGEN